MKSVVPRYFLRPVPILIVTGLIHWAGFLSSAPLVREIRFEGNKALSTKALSARLVTRPGVEFSDQTWKKDLEALSSLYRDQGYWEAVIRDSIRTEGEKTWLRVRISEGPRTVIGKVSFLQARELTDGTLLSLLALPQGGPFRQQDFEQGIERILSRYEEIGHPLTRIQTEDFERQGNRLNFSLRLWEGPRVALDSIRVQGNEGTQARVVTREFHVRHGEIYRKSKIEEGRRRILGTGYFQEVLEPEVIPFANQDSFRLVWHATLLEKVKEGRANTAEGVLGYVPREGQKGYLSGFLTASLRNLLGTGRQVGLRWEQLVPSSSLLYFSYEEPYVFSLPLTLGGDVTHEVKDSSYIRTAGSIYARVPLSEEVSLTLGFGRERVVPGSRQNNPNERSDKSLSDFGLAYQKLDLPLNPRSGVDLSGTGEYGIKTFPGVSGNVKVTQTEGDASFFIPLGKGAEGSGYALAALLHGRATVSTEKFIPPSEEYYLGGANSLRGYEEQQFLGSRLAWGNFELRRLLSRTSRVAVFWDIGYYAEKRMNPLLPDSTERVRGTKQGYGIGLREGSETTLLKIDYALGQGQTFGQGKIHVGIENRF